MPKIRKIYSSVWEKWAKKSIFGQKRPNLAKILKTIILPQKLFSSFFKRPKNRFLWQKSGTFIVAFGRNGPKRAFLAKKRPNLGKKRPKNLKGEFSPGIFLPFFKRPKNQSYGKNQEHLQQRLGEMGQKQHFWSKTDKFWLKTTKKTKTRIFAKNPKRHKSKFYGCPTSCKKPEQIIARFQLQNRNGRTHAHE